MKNQILFFTMTILVVFLIGSTLPTKNETPELGTIVYSVLSPDLFREQNGNGWVLLDGGEDLKSLGLNIKETDLCQVAGNFCNAIPDARGYFFRSHDNRKEDRIDQDRSIDSKIGSLQSDNYKKHSHKTRVLKNSAVRGTDRTIATTDTHYNDNRYSYGKDDKLGFPKISYEGGSETRPMNLNFFTYIKINKD